jgi:GAF domain-containing protein
LDGKLPPDELVLGPFVGKVACTRIPFGKGVCGTAAELDQSQRVEDVHAFVGHIACDADSASEIVVPLRANGKVIGVLDIDSPTLCRFSEEDKEGIEGFVQTLESVLTRLV